MSGRNQLIKIRLFYNIKKMGKHEKHINPLNLNR